MKTIKKSLFTLMLLAPMLAIFSSCEKDMNNKVTLPKSNNTIAQIESFFSSNAPIVQSFQLNAGTYNTITGAEGTSITIPYDAFVDANGNPVTGNFTFELQEVFSLGDMILTGKMTTSGGQLLVSGGEMYINATQGSSQLRLAPGKALDFKVPADSYDNQMALFVGNGQDGDDFDWVANTTNPVSSCPDSLNLFNYCFSLDTLINWINCDYFNNDPRPKTKIEAQVPQGYDDQNTLVYIYIPSINSVTQVRLFQNGSFFTSNGYFLPVGLNVTFVSVYHDGTNFAYALQNAIIVNNHVEVLSFQTVTAAQLAVILQNL